MLKRIFLLFISIFTLLEAQALSIGISKEMIDSALIKKFPLQKYTITLDHPILKFKKEIEKIEICGKWSEKITRSTGDFCLDALPVWNKGKGDIEIAKLNILKLNAKDLGELPPEIARALNTSVLNLLDGTSIYHVPDLVGKFLENIQVEDNGLRLLF